MAAMTSCENALLVGFGFTTLNWKLLYRLQQIQNQSLFGAFVTSRQHEFYRRFMLKHKSNTVLTAYSPIWAK